MPRKMTQFRDPSLSLWQSAVDEVVSRSNASAIAKSANSPVAVTRPSPDQVLVSAADSIAEAVKQTGSAPDVATPQKTAALSFGSTAKFCATTAFKLATAKLKGDAAEAARLEKELDATMGPCDPRWAQVVAIYLAHKATGDIPYRSYTKLSDFVIDGRLPAKCRVALLADWGTGDDGARFLLKQIASKKPDVVIHLGDVYYSGTEHEFQNYFYKIWQATFGIESVAWGSKPSKPTTPATFTLVGNHDMYAGGGPYYTTIDMLGQPASYFCLRNDDWQFIALDTGLHDSNPVAQTNPTFLKDEEVAWLKDKIANAGGRKTVLLSHHQLFSAFEQLGGSDTNQQLLQQVKDILPQVTVWFWGHEHNLVIFNQFQGVLARCIGHGAFPVAVDDVERANPGVPVQNIALAPDKDGALFQHGYVIFDIDGASARATYFQFDAVSQQEVEIHSESFGAGAAGG
jgi:calcineurin-like phosphoesterase family protein